MQKFPIIFDKELEKVIVHETKEVKYMARNGNLVPESKSKMNSFKSEVASSLNINLQQGYNGDMTTREAGSIGGEMVKRMIAYAEKNMH